MNGSSTEPDIWLWSDLHLEFPEHARVYGQIPPPSRGDLVILAGDINAGAGGVRWAVRNFPDSPVAYVLGNHEPYGADLESEYDACRAASVGTNVRVLERDVWDIGPNRRLLGATLWTDYDLWGQASLGDPHKAALRLADHHTITTAGRPFSPSDALQRHVETRAWLDAELRRARQDGVEAIVVTHHAPHAVCLAPAHLERGEPLSAAFASDLSDLLMGPLAPRVWCSGHTHHNHRGRIGSTLLLSNQAGYLHQHEGAGFHQGGLRLPQP